MSDDLASYNSLWASLKPAILQHMTALSAYLKGLVPYFVSSPIISGPDEEFCSDEYRVSVDLKNEHDINVMSAEFILRDGADNGENGFAIACVLTGYDAIVLGAFSPSSYSSGLFTLDKEILASRVEEFDAYEFALAIENALQDKNLLKIIAV